MKIMMRISEALLFLALMNAACRHGEKRVEQVMPERVRLTPVTSRMVSHQVRTSGMLAPMDEMKLSFKTGGIVSRIFIREGDRVRKRDVLATLDLLEIKASVEQAEVAYDKALRDFRRADTLVKQGSLSLEKKQNAETAMNIAGKTLEIARFNMQHSKIEAPDNGVIMKQFVRENELVSSGYPVFLFGASGEFWKVKASLSDRDLIKVRPGDSAAVMFDAYPGIRFPAVVGQVGGMANPYTGTYEAELIVSGSGYRLAAGFIASAEISSSDRISCTMVPVVSVVEADGLSGFVYALESPDSARVKKLKVSISFITGQMVAVTGIPGNYSFVVTEGSAYLRDGSVVEVVR